MKGIQEIFFFHADTTSENVKVAITDEHSRYTAIVDYKQLIYALKEDLKLEVTE